MMRPRESPALSSMTSAQRATPAGAAVRRALAGNLIRAQHEIHAPCFNGADGHAGKACRSRVLRKCGAATLLEGLYAEGTVGAFAREDHADRAMAMLFRERGEQNIPGMMQSAWVGCHANAPTGHSQRGICGYHVDVVLLHYRAVVRVYHRKNRALAESFEQ